MPHDIITSRLYLIIGMFCTHITARVSWELSSDSVLIGDSIILTCTVDGIERIDQSITRQWTIGLDGQLICFNGRRNNPLKYEEILTTGNQFSLKINHVTETDLQSLYECRYGFDILKKQLLVDKNKIIYPLEKNNETNITYTIDGSTAIIKISFWETSPPPNCSVEYQNKTLSDFVAVPYSENTSYVQATVTLPCTRALCKNEYNIACYIGSSKYYIDRPEYLVTYEVYFIHIIIVTSISTCCMIPLTLCTRYFWRIKRLKSMSENSPKHNKEDETTSQSLV